MTLWLALLISAGLAPDPPGADAARPVDYSRDVRPILSGRCFQCHGPDEKARKADLRLDIREGATKELPSGGPALVPGKPDESELIERLTTDDPTRVMPPPKSGGKPLMPNQVATLRRWIAQDAPYTQHWAYRRPVRPELPAVSDPLWPLNPIDRFSLARLDREGLRPTPPADRPTLLRRASLDLTGLPPTPDDLRQFLADDRPDAFEHAVDGLLARPQYGERWATMWLDLARYADSQGSTTDLPRTIWRWRDGLVRDLNDNLPYDRLTMELLAGDLLPAATPSQVVASGFHRHTSNNGEGGVVAEEYRHAAVVDRVNTTMQAWLGTTIGCAQCHSHKYDPFSQKEYYQLFAIFNQTEDNNTDAPTLETARLGMEAEFAALSASLAEARMGLDAETGRVDAGRESWEKDVDRAKLPPDVAAIVAIPAGQRNEAQLKTLAAHHRATSPEWSAANQAVAGLQARLDQAGTTTPIMKDGPPRPTHVAIRGEYLSKGDPVDPGVPAALNPAPAGGKLDRLGLARWIVDPENPLTARVAVNRLWQEVFGVGLVETSEEFGNQGAPPSHPELLDWLATEYVRLGWDTKGFLRLLVTSATYRQGSQADDALNQRDPANRLLARGPRVRLSAEAVRDQALAVSGLLSARLYGPPVHPPQPTSGLVAAFGGSTDWEPSRGDDAHRRALYTHWQRNLPSPSMVTFDAPERIVCNVRRIRTNTPLQALVTLNDPVYIEAAQALGRRLVAEGGPSTQSRVEYGVRLGLGRHASAPEADRLWSLFRAARSELSSDPARATALATKPIGPLPPGLEAVDAAAWTVVGNVLLNLDEFLTKR